MHHNLLKYLAKRGRIDKKLHQLPEAFPVIVLMLPWFLVEQDEALETTSSLVVSPGYISFNSRRTSHSQIF
jgi:hypothetical protein